MTTELWLPGAKHATPSAPGGAMDGTAPRAVVWHTTENDPAHTDVDDVTAWLVRESFEPHVVWHPLTGEFRQLIPANLSSRALRNDGTLRTNRVGTIRVQIEVVGHAAQPFTDGPMVGRSQLVAWLDSLGVPRSWPFGAPTPYPVPVGVHQDRDVTTYKTRSGHLGHCNVPGNDHGDPGAIAVGKLTPPLPKPKPSPEADMTIEELKAALRTDPELNFLVARAVWSYENAALTTHDAYAHLLTAGPIAGDKTP
jgi:hypothetical protein